MEVGVGELVDVTVLADFLAEDTLKSLRFPYQQLGLCCFLKQSRSTRHHAPATSTQISGSLPYLKRGRLCQNTCKTIIAFLSQL